MELCINHLTKIYGRKKALDDFTIQLQSGVLGLLGPNGAGKSTLLRMLSTTEKPSSGEIIWNGANTFKHPNQLRYQLGFLPQEFGVYPNMTAVEFLKYMAAIKGLPMKVARKRIYELLEALNLSQDLKRPLGTYSGGMKQRVGIAQALLNDPSLLIVDEPTVGLDPEERMRFQNLLSSISSKSIVILSTHIVSDVESIANKIAIVNKGKLLVYANPHELIKSVSNKVWEVIVPTTEELNIYKQKFIISRIVHQSEGIYIRIISDYEPKDAQHVSASLEDAYLYYINSNRRGVDE